MAMADFDNDLFRDQSPGIPLISMKACSKCRLTKPAGEFSCDRTKADGRYSRCKACHGPSNAARHATRQAAKIANGTKLCESCKLTKPSSGFTPTKGRRLALARFCMDCQAASRRRDKPRKPFARSKNAAKNSRAYRARLAERESVAVPKDRLCISCKANKPFTAFARCKSEKAGIKRICRKCADKKRRLARALPKKPPCETRKCNDCQRQLPQKSYSKKSDSRDGLASICRDCARSRMQVWYSRPGNPEKVSEKAKIWGAANPDLLVAIRRVSKQNRRVAKAASEGSFSSSEWVGLVAQFNSCCGYCLRGENIAGPMTAEHMLPISRGGSNYIENIIPACRSCNSAKRNSTLLEFLVRERPPPALRR